MGELRTNAQITNTPVSAATPPPNPPVTKSPITAFRELLNMEPGERTKALADRPEVTRKRILAKIREYQSLKPDERELRLKVTELGYYLRPLLLIPSPMRNAQLAQVPGEYRELIQVRLKKWDTLTPDAQQKLLQNEAAIRSLTELTNATPANVARPIILVNTISNWNRLSENERQELSENFDYFFKLKPTEREKAVKSLSDSERRQIVTTLRKFGQLTSDQRAQCIKSFEKLAAMSPSERMQFFKNAERWELMTPREREDWRKLVETAKLLPPSTSLPPVPPTVPVSGTNHVVTNRY